MKRLFVLLLTALFTAGVSRGQVDENWIKKSAVDRLVKYVKIDTQSKEEADQVPSTRKQLDLAGVLLKELQELGLQDARLDKDCCRHILREKHPSRIRKGDHG
ncbi:MAG: hypothetical protein M1469_11365 [Bacteroidetes bacterium]|nr:hypothetical protein [Bacteroidota bacterium]